MVYSAGTRYKFLILQQKNNYRYKTESNINKSSITNNDGRIQTAALNCQRNCQCQAATRSLTQYTVAFQRLRHLVSKATRKRNSGTTASSTNITFRLERPPKNRQVGDGDLTVTVSQ